MIITQIEQKKRRKQKKIINNFNILPIDENITASNPLKNVSIYHEYDHSDGNYSQPVLIAIREVIRDPHSLEKREWHWYRWTRTKYLTHKFTKNVRKQNVTVPFDNNGQIEEHIIVCRPSNDSSLDDFPEDLFTRK